MWKILPLLFLLWLGAARASAQAAPAGRSSLMNVAIGYSYVNSPDSASQRMGLNGWDVDLTMRVSSRLGVRGDLARTRSSHVPGMPGSAALTSYLAGPVFYPTNSQGRLVPYVHLLLGGARVTGPVPVSGGFLVGGWLERSAWAFGGGVDYQLSAAFALRGGVDFLRAQYYGPSLTPRGQSNVRATASIVYLFRALGRRRR